jgi:hypothetical protein
MSKKYYKSDLLFPRTNFITGMGSIFNIAGNYYGFNRSATSNEADKKAIESDWGVVGKDIEKAIQSQDKKSLCEF